MDLGLKGRVAVVGGASQGIGYAIALMLAGEGCRLSLFARSEAKLAAAADKIHRQTGADVYCVAGDVADANDNERLISETVAQFGRLDIVVNNDGAPPVGPSHRFDDDTWLNAVQQNLMGPVRLIRHATPHMRTAKSGRIVNITSTAVLQPPAGLSLSVAPWAGLIAHSKTLVQELGAAGITINTICPGFVETPRLGRAMEKVAGRSGIELSEEVENRVALVPLGRLGQPEDIANLAVFLASDSASYITGGVFRVDGGMVISLI